MTTADSGVADPRVATSAGTTVTLAFSFTTKSMLLNAIIGWALASQDRQLDRMLANCKKAIEA